MKPILIAVLLTASGSVASAALIYANGVPDLDSANARNITIFRTADDFVLAGASNLESIRFWMVAVPEDFGGSMTYAIYQNSSGSLGTLVQSATVNGIPLGVPDPITGFIYSMYVVDFSLPAPLALGAGTYWLELHEGANLITSDGTNNVYWARLDPLGGNAKQNVIPTLPTTGINEELAFELYGAAAGVPEPATILLSVMGLGALAMLRRRKA